MIVSQKIESSGFNSPEVIAGQFEDQVKVSASAMNNGDNEEIKVIHITNHLKGHNSNKNHNTDNNTDIAVTKWLDFRILDKDLSNIVMPFILIICGLSVIIFTFYTIILKLRNTGNKYENIQSNNTDSEDYTIQLGGRKKRLPKAVNYQELFRANKQHIIINTLFYK